MACNRLYRPDVGSGRFYLHSDDGHVIQKFLALREIKDCLTKFVDDVAHRLMPVGSKAIQQPFRAEELTAWRSDPAAST